MQRLSIVLVSLLLSTALGSAATAQEKPKSVPAKPATTETKPAAALKTKAAVTPKEEPPAAATAAVEAAKEPSKEPDYSALLFVFAMATFIGLGVVARVSRLLHTPLMSLTNAISAIAIVGAIIVTGTSTDTPIRIMGAVALFASMTNVVSGFLITDRMLKMFKQTRTEGK